MRILSPRATQLRQAQQFLHGLFRRDDVYHLLPRQLSDPAVVIGDVRASEMRGLDTVGISKRVRFEDPSVLSDPGANQKSLRELYAAQRP
jgi:hypothetical protein